MPVSFSFWNARVFSGRLGWLLCGTLCLVLSAAACTAQSPPTAPVSPAVPNIAPGKTAAYAVDIHFTGGSALFPNAYLKPPVSAVATFLDPVQERETIDFIQRLLREQLARYPAKLLAKNLKEIYVVKSLSENGTPVGGLNWPSGKRLYLQDNGIRTTSTEPHLRLILHHELAHLLLDTHTSLFSRSRWECLNLPTFHYGSGGLASIRSGENGTTELDPASWEQGFANIYGRSGLDEDVACLCQTLFSGDPRFWQSVDRVDILNKKVAMVLAFYRALDPTLTEAYFRGLPPLTGAEPGIKFLFRAGDTISFPNGGKIVYLENPNRTVEYPPGSTAVFSGKDIVEWYPPAK
jgi:hypothetical protein